MSWIIIAALIVLLLLFTRAKHMRNRFYLIILILIVIFVYTTASKVLANENLSLKSASDIATGTKIYFSWLVSVFSNFREMAGNAIRMDWKLNSTAG